MKKLDVKEGDVLVISSPHDLSEEAIKRIKDVLTSVMKGYGYNVHALFFTDGLTVEKKWKA